MAAYSVSMPLIVTKRSCKFKLFILVGLLFLLIALISLFWIESAFKVYFFIAGLISFWVGTLFKDYDKIGAINWSVDRITTEEKVGTKTYAIQDVKNIDINLRGVEGEIYSIKTMARKQGSGNYIRFDYCGENKVYQFLLEDPHIPFLRALLEEWRRNGVGFSINDATYRNFPA